MNDYIDSVRIALEPYPWAWTTLVVVVLLLLAWLANILTKRILLRGLKHLLRATVFSGAHNDDVVKVSVIPRLANVIPALVVYAGITAVPDIPPQVITVVRGLCQAFIVLTVALSLGRAANLANVLYERKPDAHEKPIKGYLQVFKIIVYVFAGISIFATLIGAEFKHVLTGLGAMTAVTMLIFQDTILSLVASVQISGDGRVRVGDWIEMPSQNADGDVIDIALHTVTVRNWDRTVTTVPTKKLVSDSFKNWRQMFEGGGRRIKRSLFIDQHTVRFLEADEVDRFHRFVLLDDYLDGKAKELSEWNGRLSAQGAEPVNNRRVTNLGTFRAYVNHYLRNHPGIHQGLTLLVRQMQPTAQGIPLEIYCFTSDVSWAGYEGVQADIFDHLLAILPEFGLAIYQECSDAALDVHLRDARKSRAPALPASPESKLEAGAPARE